MTGAVSTPKGPGELSPSGGAGCATSHTNALTNSCVSELLGGWEHGTPTARKAIAGGYHGDTHISSNEFVLRHAHTQFLYVCVRRADEDQREPRRPGHSGSIVTSRFDPRCPDLAGTSLHCCSQGEAVTANLAGESAQLRSSSAQPAPNLEPTQRLSRKSSADVPVLKQEFHTRNSSSPFLLQSLSL